MSYRRQVYIAADDVNKLPESIKIDYDNNVNWIYPTTDTVKCFICNTEGHIAKNCDKSDTDLDFTKPPET